MTASAANGLDVLATAAGLVVLLVATMVASWRREMRDRREQRAWKREMRS